MKATLPNALYVGGEWALSTSGGFEAVINPADESVIGEAPVGGVDDLESALAAARDAFDRGPWPRMSVAERVAVMERFWAALAARRDEIVGLIVREAGATQMLAAFMQFDIPMKHARRLLEDSLRLTAPATPVEITPAMDGRLVLGSAVTVYEPHGVVAAITPYNFPFFLNIVKLFHALPMGNAVVLKPSPFTPFEALILGEAATAAGLPPGVLNIVTGDIDIATRLTVDPRVDMVSFTGSDKVGAAIMAQSAPTLKKMHLELGGKSALIVRHDADLSKCLESALAFVIHAGQGCALPTRHLVHNAVRKDYVNLLSQYLPAMKIGNPIDPAVRIGPLIRPSAVERTENYVAMGLDSGARLVCGGSRPTDLTRGFYYQPTLLDDVDNASAVAQDEIFGPVAVVVGFDSDDEAVELANHSHYGLNGAICSADAGAAFQMALRLRTGGVAINGGAGTMLSGAPFGGYKRSGIGREYGPEGLLEFCQLKSISFRAA